MWWHNKGLKWKKEAEFVQKESRSDLKKKVNLEGQNKPECTEPMFIH